MILLAVAFIAGILTVFAPCIFPVLPVILGTTAVRRGKYTPYVVVASLSLSIVVFTFLLKVTTLFVIIPPYVWTYFSGSIIVLFGVLFLFPRIATVLSTSSPRAYRLMGRGIEAKSYIGDMIVGAALGPVFASCSPIYFFILATALPASFVLGSGAIIAYAAGLGGMLLVVALLGERFIGRLSGLTDPRGVLRRTIGVVFIILGLLIVFGLEKRIEAYILENSVIDISTIEYRLLKLLPDSL